MTDTPQTAPHTATGVVPVPDADDSRHGSVTRASDVEPNSWADIVNSIGYVLGVTYPVLAISTGARALYQLAGFKEGASTTAAVLSLVAALCYLAATIGFFRRRPWAWWVSVVALAFELTMVLVIGVVTTVNPDIFGDETVWSRFGVGYGFFPLIQPLLGLVWLLRPRTLVLYDVSLRRH